MSTGVIRALCAVLLAATLMIAPAADATAQQPDRSDAEPAFRITDDRVVESSGLAASRTRPDLVYTVNDSGDDARVLVVSVRDGAVVGEARLDGVEADDFEALAPAPGGRLVVGDIGDNGADREHVELYVLDEPGTGETTVTPRRVTLRYPGGARDAEALVVVGQSVFVVSKQLFGGDVFVAPALTDDRDSHTLRRVGPAPAAVTDAALLDDGDVVLRDYVRGFVMDPSDWEMRATFELPRVSQGETLAAVPGRRQVYAGSEGEDSPVFVVPVPRGDRRAVDDSQPADSPARADPDASEGSSESPRPLGRPAGYVVVLALGMVAGLLLRRARRRRRVRPDARRRGRRNG